MTPVLGREVDTLKDVGNGAIAIFKAVVIVAIVAVVLANGSNTVAAVQQFFGFLIWLVGLVVAPITGGSTVDLSQASPTGTQTATQTNISTAPTGNAIADGLNSLQSGANSLGSWLNRLITGGNLTGNSTTVNNPSPGVAGSQTGVNSLGLGGLASNPGLAVTDNGNGTSTLTPIPSPF